MATALVLAADSFIGRHLCQELVEHGHRLVATSCPPANFPGSLTCDLLREDEVGQRVAQCRPDWIVQCAGETRSKDPGALYRLHVTGAEHLLRAVRDHAPGAVMVFFGSAAEYGAVPAAALPVAESYPGEPGNFFAASKLAQTQLVAAAAREWNLRTLVVRPANVVGPGLGDQYLAAALVARLRRELAERSPPECQLAVANGQATRDFVDVRDVARALRLLLEKAPPEARQCEIYNVATGGETPVLEVARILGELAGGVRIVDAGPEEDRSGISRSACDPRKLTRATGWRPEIPLARSLADLWRQGAEPH